MATRWWVPFAFLAPALAGLLVFRFAPIVIAVVGSLFGTSIRGLVESIRLGVSASDIVRVDLRIECAAIWTPA